MASSSCRPVTPLVFHHPASCGREPPERQVCLDRVVQALVDVVGADLINETTARAFSQISLETGIPVLDGVVSAENLEQAVERCGTKQGNKGFSAMQAAIEMAQVLKAL